MESKTMVTVLPQVKQQLSASAMTTANMQQYLHLLQLPSLELDAFINQEIVQNPLLEIVEESELDSIDAENKPESYLESALNFLFNLSEEWDVHFNASSSLTNKIKEYQESLITKDVSLFDHLNAQATEAFTDKQELDCAAIIIGYLDSKGFLHTSSKEICAYHDLDETVVEKVLSRIKTFDPAGVAAASIQESLLLQLDNLGKKNSLTYDIVANFYPELIKNKLSVIAKKAKVSLSQIVDIIQTELVSLSLSPGSKYSSALTQYIKVDAEIYIENGILKVKSKEDYVDKIHLNKKYLKLLTNNNSSLEVKNFIKNKLFSAKWLTRNLLQRAHTINLVIENIVSKQEDFFLQNSATLKPMTMREVALDLDLHESTIARAVAHKYVNTPKGIFAIKYFFSGKYLKGVDDEISQNSVKDIIKQIVAQENKNQPLSDEAISKKLRAINICCSRRTVSKHRQGLNIASSRQRKRY